MKVNLKEIVEGLTMVDDSTIVYFDRDKNVVDYVFTDWIDEELDETIPENIIHLPSRYEIDEYRMMEDFIYSLPDGDKKVMLWDAINGRGAFRNFKNLIRHFDIQEHWYDFQYKEYAKVAKRWCRENNLEYFE